MKLENWRDQPATAKEFAIFDVHLDNIGLTVHQFKIVRKKDGGWFISAPSFSKANPDGTKTWLPYISLLGDRKKQFYDKLEQLVREVLK
jgi:hypothetical protein